MKRTERSQARDEPTTPEVSPDHPLPPRSKHEEDWDIEHAHVDRKGNRTMLLALIILSVGIAAVAQIVLKHGMNQVADRSGPFHLSGHSLRTVAVTPAVWIGLALFGLSAFVWLAVLSRAALSFAYPFAALTYVVIVAYDTMRGEQVGALRWAGVALIVTGIIFVSRTSHT